MANPENNWFEACCGWGCCLDDEVVAEQQSQVSSFSRSQARTQNVVAVVTRLVTTKNASVLALAVVAAVAV
jgi:hypothetical protein